MLSWQWIFWISSSTGLHRTFSFGMPARPLFAINPALDLAFTASGGSRRSSVDRCFMGRLSH
jgi:hypothetical protein